MAEFSVADELIKLKGLLDAGILTQDEFEAQKASLLSRNSGTPCENEKIIEKIEELFEIKYVGRKPVNKRGNDSEYPVIRAIRQFLDSELEFAEVKELVNNPPLIIKTGTTMIFCEHARGVIENAGGEVEITKVGERVLKINRGKKDNSLKCPKCGSTAITTGPRGVNFTMGLIGASKTVNRCAKCGNTWTPGK